MLEFVKKVRIFLKVLKCLLYILVNVLAKTVILSPCLSILDIKLVDNLQFVSNLPVVKNIGNMSASYVE